jgi:hypothetical protein
MNEHHPRVRIRAENGYLLIREGLSISFYMRRSHQEVAREVLRSLDVYLEAVGSPSLGWYDNGEGEWKRLDEAGWAHNRHELLDMPECGITLRDASSEHRYGFMYQGKQLDDPFWVDEPGAGCAVSFLLPTEYMEERGPERVRELALALATPLPFNSGHASLSFNGETDVVSMPEEVRKRCLRYPGIDIPNLSWLSWKLGTRVRGAYWLTFLGEPVLGSLGGAAGLRSRLASPESSVQEMEGARVVVTLGRWPEAGDTEQGRVLPAWRELARVLEPWMYHEEHIRLPDFEARFLRRWERRFLD